MKPSFMQNDYQVDLEGLFKFWRGYYRIAAWNGSHVPMMYVQQSRWRGKTWNHLQKSLQKSLNSDDLNLDKESWERRRRE